MRLNKFISESGLCSRREADRYIEQGKVFIKLPAETWIGWVLMMVQEDFLKGTLQKMSSAYFPIQLKPPLEKG